MTSNAEEIHSLIEERRYDAGIIPELESFLEERLVAKGEEDIDVLLALVKLYQFHPEKLNFDILVKVLLKCLMCLPDNIFQLALCMLPESVHREDTIVELRALSSKLELGEYPVFWKLWEEKNLPLLPGFIEKIRMHMFSVISRTFKVIPLTTLKQNLNLNDSETTIFLEANSLREKDGKAILPTNDETKGPNIRPTAGLRFNDISAILKK